MDGMPMKYITVRVGEIPRQVIQGITVYGLRDTMKPGADIVIVNGAPLTEDREAADGDGIVFITRGEMPAREELEALMMSRHTPGVHAALKGATVGVAGLGGLGSAVAISLARVGVGHLILVDFDVVEPSNLNRQQYFIDQIGMLKTDALADTLLRVNPYVKVRKSPVRVTSANIDALFQSSNVVVEAFDSEEAKVMLVENMLRFLPGIPVVAASGMAGYGSANLVRTERIGKRLYLCGDRVASCTPGCGLMAPRVGVAASHQANAVLRLLLGETEQ